MKRQQGHASPVIRADIAKAGVPRADDTVFTAESLRSQADGKNYFWDEETQTLYYQGPEPTRKT
jgi:hypothetical protein